MIHFVDLLAPLTIVCFTVQEFAKVVEADNIKQDLIPLFHNLAGDEQVHFVVH